VRTSHPLLDAFKVLTTSSLAVVELNNAVILLFAVHVPPWDTDRAALLQVAVLSARALNIHIVDSGNPSGLSWPYVTPVEFILADTHEGVVCVLDADICSQTSAQARRAAAYKRIAHQMDGELHRRRRCSSAILHLVVSKQRAFPYTATLLCRHEYLLSS
jgi:hypothetical protein